MFLRKATERLSYASTNFLKDGPQNKLIHPWISSALSIQEPHSKIILAKHKFHPSCSCSDWEQVVITWIFRPKAEGLPICHFSLKRGCPNCWVSRHFNDSKWKVGPMSTHMEKCWTSLVPLFSCILLFLKQKLLWKGSLMKLGLLTFTSHTPSAFELNLAQVIIQIVYATSQNSNSWKGKMNKHLLCNSCTVGGWFKPPIILLFKVLRDTRYFQLLKHFHSASFCWINGLIFFLTGCSEKNCVMCFALENIKSIREKENRCCHISIRQTRQVSGFMLC